MAVRFGVVGTNFITDRFLDAGSAVEGFSLSAVYSRTAERAAEFASKHAAPHAFTDLEVMASSKTIDAVYIASPTSCHAEQCLVFISHGIHVLCEKPVCSNARELERVLQAAEGAGVAFMEAMRSLCAPNFRATLKNRERVGRVRHFAGGFCQLSSRWPKYLKGERPNAFLPELSNGALMDIGVYTISAAVALLGAPTTVQYFPLMLDTGVDGGGTVILTYPEAVATLVVSKCSHSFSDSEVQGEDGTLVIDKLDEWSSVTFKTKAGGSEVLSDLQAANNMLYEVQDFVAMVLEGRSQHDILTWEHSRAVMGVLDEARRSGGIVFPADER